MTTAAKLAAQLRELREKATPGEWYAHDTDDDVYMTAYCVAGKREPEMGCDGPIEAEKIIAVTLLQSPQVACHESACWEMNAHFIAYCGTHALAIAAALEEQQAEIEKLRVEVAYYKAEGEMNLLMRLQASGVQVDETVMAESANRFDLARLARERYYPDDV